MGDPETITAAVLQPGEVVEVGAVEDRRHDPCRLERACLLRDCLGRSDDDISLPCNQTRDRLADLLLGAYGSPLDAPVRMSADGVAKVSDPTHSGDPLHRGADEMHRVRRRRRDDHIDPLCARDANRRRDRSQIPAHVLVRHEHAARKRARLARQPIEAAPAVQLVRELARAGPEVAGAMDPGLSRRHEVGIGVDPLRIVRREDVRLDSVRRQMRCELQRPLHAAPS